MKYCCSWGADGPIAVAGETDGSITVDGGADDATDSCIWRS
jgi:hypothetical protein